MLFEHWDILDGESIVEKGSKRNEFSHEYSEIEQVDVMKVI